MSAATDDVKSIFGQALERPDPAARAAYLAEACGENASLRAEVEGLLAAMERAGDFLNRASNPPDATLTHGDPAATGTFRPAPSTEAEGTIIAGRYKLLQQIGEGGMGTVWMADQTEPVKRKVAVKLIRVERGQSKTILARFGAERQAIALMDHPHIAKLLDAGTTETGSPFFIMELVKGIPLTDYCDTHKLSIQERLGLFQQICSAVQHAHQKGIIHRDLKPTNILVESHDGKPVPKVIDFGLAKATTGLQLTEHTMFTAFGSVMGTPLYMAPEQATFNSVDIDTRADVYALGVILYEMLTGTTPITRDTLKKAALDEMLRLVREQEAPTPSSRLSSSDSLPSVWANRQTEPQKLGRYVKGELDWIVLKALSKDRDRRYETANGFARDIERFLNHEPVTAGPPSTRYRLQKFVQRNRGQVIAASLLFFALLAGIAGTTIGLFEAKKQERFAVAAQNAEAERAEGERLAKLDAQDKETLAITAAAAEKAAKLDADAKRKEAERNLAYARKGNEILGSVFAGLNPTKIAESGRPLQDVLLENLVKAIKELDGSAIGDPMEVAVMQNTLGSSLIGLGEYGPAVEVLEKAHETHKARLGPDHPRTLTCMSNLALGYKEVGKLDRALPLLEQTLAGRNAQLGPDHPATLTCMNDLGIGYMEAGKLDRAVPLLEQTLAKRTARLGPDHIDVHQSSGNLAQGYSEAGRYDRALPLYERALALSEAKHGPDHPTTLICMSNLADGYRQAGKLDRALPLAEQTLTVRKAKLGPDHPATLTSMNNLAICYSEAGMHDRALPLAEQALKLTEAKLGPDHPATFLYTSNLARCRSEAGMHDQALPLYEQALKRTEDKLGPDHPNTFRRMTSLAAGYREVKKLDRAVPLFEQALALQKAKLGPDHPDTIGSLDGLASCYHQAGKLDRAVPMFEQTLTLRKAKLGPDHPDTLNTMNSLAAAYWSLKRLDRSVLLFEKLLPLQEKRLGRGHPHTHQTVFNLGVNYRDAGRLTEAITLLEEAYRASAKRPALHFMGQALLDGYMMAGKRAEAGKLSGELLADALQRPPADSPRLSAMLAVYGQYLLDSKAYAAAEPPLWECLAIRQKTEPDGWRTFNTQSMLSESLLGQKKYADAEPLLLKGYEGLKAREKTIPPQASSRIPEALDRLIELYTATNKPDEVKKWQAERAKYPTPKEVAPMPPEKK